LAGGGVVDIGVSRAAVLACLALRAQAAGDGFALGQGLGQKSLLPGRLLHLPAKLQVLGVVQAESIAVRQQPALPVKIQHGRVGQQRGPATCHQGLTNQEVAVAMHEKKRQPLCGRGHLLRATGFKALVLRTWIAQCVVANPDFKNIAEQEDGVGGGAVKIARPGAEGGGFFGTQVQVGNEIDRGPGDRRLQCCQRGHGHGPGQVRVSGQQDGFFDHHVGLRHVFMKALAACLDAGNFVDDFGAGNNLGKHGVTPAGGCGR